MGLRKLYWPQLVMLVHRLCRYYTRYKPFLPADLPPAAIIALDALEAACDLLIAYDIARKRGNFAAPESDGD